MSGSHLDQAYLGESADNALIATASAGAAAPGAVDASSLVAAPLPPKNKVLMLGLAAAVGAFILCRLASKPKR